MTLKQQLTAHYQQRTLKRIQKRFSKLQQSKGKAPKSQLKQWLQAADQVDRFNRRVQLSALALVVLLPAIWFALPHLDPLASTPPTAKNTPATISSPPPAAPKRHFQVQLQLQQDLPETAQIIDKIRLRPLPIKIKPAPQQGDNMLLLTDDTPTTRKDAERLRDIYTQLFGVEVEIIESISNQSVETAGDASI